MKKILLVILPLLFLTVLINCKKQQPQINEDIKNPCDCAHEVSADFDIFEVGGTWSEQTLTDTIYHDKYVIFKAKDTIANYTWYIGSEVFNTKEVTKFFDNSLIGQNIPIALVVKKEPNTYCFPNDDGYDSIVKSIYVSQYIINDFTNTLNYGPIEGTYRVKSEHKADSFDIVFYTTLNFQNENMFNIENYDGEGSNCLNQALVTGANYREVWTKSGTSVTQCDYIQGSIHNRLDGVTEMNFSFGSSNVNADYYYERKYLGRKLN